MEKHLLPPDKGLMNWAHISFPTPPWRPLQTNIRIQHVIEW